VAPKLAPCRVSTTVRTVTVWGFFLRAVRVAWFRVQVRALVPFRFGLALARQTVAPLALVAIWVTVAGPVVATPERMAEPLATGLGMPSFL
jgi:hypothetical protein